MDFGTALRFLAYSKPTQGPVDHEIAKVVESGRGPGGGEEVDCCRGGGEMDAQGERQPRNAGGHVP